MNQHFIIHIEKSLILFTSFECKKFAILLFTKFWTKMNKLFFFLFDWKTNKRNTVIQMELKNVIKNFCVVLAMTFLRRGRRPRIWIVQFVGFSFRFCCWRMLFRIRTCFFFFASSWKSFTFFEYLSELTLKKFSKTLVILSKNFCFL